MISLQRQLPIILVSLLSIAPRIANAQNLFSGYENLFTNPRSYVAMHTVAMPLIDGNVSEEAWKNVPWTDFFQDIEGNKIKPSPRLKTRAKMMWDDNNLYVAAEMEEPDVWANLTERDQIVFHDNDFEIFVDPSNSTHNYFEIEINARNTIFDLFLPKPYRNQGGVVFGWNAPGMKHAVRVNGSLNRPGDKDRGWTAEFAIPWTAITVGGGKHLPANGEIWRINFSRVEWDVDKMGGAYVKQKDASGKVKPENNWVWSPQGVIDMHRPERWGYLQFYASPAGSDAPTFERPYTEYQRDYLWLTYYKQKDFQRINKRYASTLQELGLPSSVPVRFRGSDLSNKLSMEATSDQFRVSISDGALPSISLTEDGLIGK